MNREYIWETVNDPSGCFQSRLFRLSDITQSAASCDWQDGTRWRNIRTSEMLMYFRGQLLLGGVPVKISANKMAIRMSQIQIASAGVPAIP